MKKIIISLVFLILILSWYKIYNEYILDSNFSLKSYKENMNNYRPSYELPSDEDLLVGMNYGFKHEWNSVFYNDIELVGVKAKWFIMLEQFGISKDGLVFHEERLLTGIDGKTIHLFPYNTYYIADKNWYYSIPWWNMKKINTNGDLHTYPWYLNTQFAYDDSSVYYYGDVLTWILPDKISFYENSIDYFLYSWVVYRGTKPCPTIDAESFVSSSGTNGLMGYAKDRNQEYFMGKVVWPNRPRQYTGIVEVTEKDTWEE